MTFKRSLVNQVIVVELCPLCNRPLAEPANRHHLMPLSKGGRNTPTVLMHKICHDKIHAVFTEIELKHYYHTIDRIKSHEEIEKFIKWLSNKDPHYYHRSARMRR